MSNDSTRKNRKHLKNFFLSHDELMILTQEKITNRTRQILDSLQEGFSRIPFTGKRDGLKLQLKPQATQAQHEN